MYISVISFKRDGPSTESIIVIPRDLHIESEKTRKMLLLDITPRYDNTASMMRTDSLGESRTSVVLRIFRGRACPFPIFYFFPFLYVSKVREARSLKTTGSLCRPRRSEKSRRSERRTRGHASFEVRAAWKEPSGEHGGERERSAASERAERAVIPRSAITRHRRVPRIALLSRSSSAHDIRAETGEKGRKENERRFDLSARGHPASAASGGDKQRSSPAGQDKLRIGEGRSACFPRKCLACVVAECLCRGRESNGER